MIVVSTRRQLQALRALPFCHACGRQIDRSKAELFDFDHIPAKTCFDEVDRDPPLKLPTHRACNNAHNLNDEKLGDLIAVHRHQAIEPNAGALRVQVIVDSNSGTEFAVFDTLDLIGSLRRWVGGFHAALYKEPLPISAHYHISPPIPLAEERATGLSVRPIPASQAPFVHTLKLNRLAKNVDAVETCRAKLRYECVWAKDDSGSHWLCIFGINLYDWIGMGDHRLTPRGCVGVYKLPSGGVPEKASRATQLQASIPNKSPFDPFGP